MQRILSNELKNQIGNEVMLEGWLHNLRTMGKLAFLILRDRTGLSQIVLDSVDEIKKLDNLYTGSVLRIVGNAVLSEKSQYGVEIQNSKIEVMQPVKYPSPVDISKNDLNVEFDTLLENRVVTLRHPKQSAIFKVAGIAEKVMRDFYNKNEFTQINSPKMIAFPTEGGAEVFEVNYFDKKAYMAQSPQFYKQMMVGVFEKVYEIGRAYRAEKSNTSRHLSEILMLDMEMGFINSFEDVLNTSESFIKYVCENTWNEAAPLLEGLGAKKPIISEKLPRISVKDLHELMKKETGEDHTSELDVAPSEEKFISEYSQKNWNSEALFIVDFPWSDAKFYHHQSETNPENADRADLIFRGVELATITRREVNYEKLVSQIQAKGMDSNHPGLAQYLEAFKFGMPEEGGFGLGIARFVQKMIGLDNVKEAELFPSDPKLIGGVRIAPKVFFGKELNSEILSQLTKGKITYEKVTHEPAKTSEESAIQRKTNLDEGVKAIILRGKRTGKNIMVCIPADQKLNMDILSSFESEKFEFENPQIIKDKFGLELGSIPPFGNLLGMPTYFSKDIEQKALSAFNDGLTTESIKMQPADLIKLINPILV